jgi:hypothetical protein
MLLASYLRVAANLDFDEVKKMVLIFAIFCKPYLYLNCSYSAIPPTHSLNPKIILPPSPSNNFSRTVTTPTHFW